MLRPVAVRAVVLVLAALVAAACSGDGGGGRNGPPDAVDLTRSTEAGGVTVEATWLTAELLGDVDADVAAYPPEGFVLVEVQFTTHSGDLNEIDMERASALRQGGAEARATDWISLSDDSHHRAGILVFQRTAPKGPVELTLDLGDEEVALLWETVPTG